MQVKTTKAQGIFQPTAQLPRGTCTKVGSRSVLENRTKSTKRCLTLKVRRSMPQTASVQV